MQQVQLYDDSLDYEQNKTDGPFGDFLSGKPYQNSGAPAYDFFGTPVYSPFGIGAGPLPSVKQIQAALNKGFDIVTLKSVRTRVHPLNPMPQIVPVAMKALDSQDTDQQYTRASGYSEPLAAANSFGIPSVAPEEWQQTIKECFELAKPGQALLVAFQGTARGEGDEAFIRDHTEGIALLRQTGTKTIEINLSCPNEGKANLTCFDTEMSGKIAEAVRAENPDMNLIMKIAYFADKAELKKFVEAVGPYVNGISAINTIARPIVDENGNDVFPGRPTAGVSGAPIKPQGLETVRELARLKTELGFDYKIIGLGGVLGPQDFADYREAGADYVFSVTGAMWNPNLAAEIKVSL